MPDVQEKRGPIEKSEKGWPINVFGVIALVILGLIIIFLIVKPLISQNSENIQNQNQVASGGHIISPRPGEIIKSNKFTIELSVDRPQDVQKVQFWAKAYADGKWEMIGEVSASPHKLDWQIPDSFRDKSIAITTHIYQKDGTLIKDPGGWREGIIILLP